MKGEGQEMRFDEAIEVFESIFKRIILNLDNRSFWIINHDDKDLNWFPNDEDNLNSLRTLFKQNNIQNTYRGALLFMKEDLYRCAKDLISYPYVLAYKSLDISHSEVQFVIKITSHLTVDLLCTDKILLRRMVNENSLNWFTIKEYR